MADNLYHISISYALPTATNHDELLTNLKIFFPSIAYTKYRRNDSIFDIISTSNYNVHDVEVKLKELIQPYISLVEPNQTPQTIDEAWYVLRRERNNRLAACDWTQLSDSPLSDTEKLIWRSYRQALRDLTDNCENPFEPQWPTTPQPILMP